MSLCAPNSPRTRKFEAIIDSGATRCVFNADLAKYLGLVLKDGIREMTTGISGSQEVWLHDVMLHVHGGPVKIRAAFQEGLPTIGLLGMSGFFEHFTITFEFASKECTLERIYHA
ncbi:MAG TPA: retropepsin-like aspartic protease [Acidobacteriaceae bacterium]|nr:retropepsin-like aspartic protease [Acidobacteriaceae bacterium]